MSPSARKIWLALAIAAAFVAVGFSVFHPNGKSTAPAAEGRARAVATNAAATSSVTDRPVDLAEAFAPRGTLSDRDALEKARAIADPVTRGEVFGRLLQRWLERDFAGALNYVRALAGGPLAESARLQALEFARKRDPWTALTVARDLANSPGAVVFYSELFDTLAHLDRARAATAIAEVPDGAARDNAIRALTDAWARADFKAALSWAETQGEASDRTAALETVLRVHATSHPAEAVDLALRWLPAAERDRFVDATVERLVTTDLGAAGNLVRALPDSETAVHAAIEVARAQAENNLTAALAWVDTLPNADTRRLALLNTLDVWSAKDAPAAMAYVAGLNAGAEQADLAGNLARILGERSPSVAVAFTETLSDPAAHASAATAAASAWARTDPAAACRWAAALPETANPTQALQGALSYWLLADRSAAAAWAQQLAEGEPRDAALRLIAQQGS